jgi:hemin uptake protein HemP
MSSPAPPRPVPHPNPSATAAAGIGLPAPRRITSEELFAGGAVEIQIEHQQQLYRLRRTALGKLILTK